MSSLLEWSRKVTPRFCCVLPLVGSMFVGCASEAPLGPARPDNSGDNSSASELTFASDITPITDAAQAKPGVFVPPYLDCRDPLPGETTNSENGKVCTHVVLSACTEPGKYYPDYASCDVVRTQRPFWDDPPAKEPDPNDPRLNDPTFMGELAWVTEQIEACGCVCCHDSRAFGGRFGQWDIARGPIWLDTLSDDGLALFAGYADSHVLGAYPPAENHGFDRIQTGVPTNDTPRMKAFLDAELTRRGISREEALAVPPFGGPIYNQSVAKPSVCAAGEGINSAGKVRWPTGTARYIYVLEAGSKNPGVPPNLDTPDGTLWRLDVLASQAPLQSGVTYGTTPPGSFQQVPADVAAPELVKGKTYQLVVLMDVGLPILNCLFVYGNADAEPELPPPPPPAPTPNEPDSDGGVSGGDGDGDASGGVCTLPGGDEQGFGVPCTSDAQCTCYASFCSMQPGAKSGICTVKGCKTNPSLCPDGWSCLDLSIFGAGLPSVCNQ